MQYFLNVNQVYASDQHPIINEVHPNPDGGSEWVELFCPEELVEINFNLNNYSLSDSYHQIFNFTEESCLNPYLTVTVSGLNNDGDQVILKDAELEIIDQMSYDKSTKGQSWLRESPEDSIFLIGEESRDSQNILPSPTPIITPTSSEITITPTPSSKTKDRLNENTTIEEIKEVEEDPQADLSSNQESFNYPIIPSEIKLSCNTDQDAKPIFENKRLVLIQQQKPKQVLLNAIINNLIIISLILVNYYVYFKQQKN